VALTVYHLKTCDTCRKAIKALKEAGHDLALVDVRADGMPPSELEKCVESLGHDKVLNTRSTTWRGLNDTAKSDVTAQKAVALMTEHPTLIKRPIITDGAKITIGWKADAQGVWT
jgi:arsenate reductase